MTIYNKILSAIGIFLFSASIAQAQTNSSFNKPTWYYGLEYYKYYEKSDSADPFMTVKTDYLPTLVLGYSDYSNIRSNTQVENPFVYFLEGTYGRNKYTNYDHSIGYGAHTDDYKAQAEAAYVFPGNIYAGLGYRYLYNKSAGAGSYERINELLYVPVGYGLKMSDGSNAKFQFNYLIEGNQKSYLSDVSSAYPDINNKQKSGWGLDLSYVPAKSNDWEFYGKYWNVKQSELVKVNNVVIGGKTYNVTFWEPQNFTYEIGFKHTF